MISRELVLLFVSYKKIRGEEESLCGEVNYGGFPEDAGVKFPQCLEYGS